MSTRSCIAPTTPGALAVDPGGSGIAADLLIAVEVPLPWPKPVFAHPVLDGVDLLAAEAAVPTRVLASVPHDPASSGYAVVAYRRAGATMNRTEMRVDATDIADAVRTMVATPTDADLDEGDSVAPPELWVCTQGSHDSCCGRDGTRLAIDVRARRGDVVVRRVSHTGGHRFAPTALTLPDGRMWGYIDPTLVDQVVDRSGAPSELAERCRGWTGAGVGPAQVAERAVFAAVGWSLDDARREITLLDDAGADGSVGVRVEATWPDGAAVVYEVDVTIVREVPTIACREPGGLPAKPGREYGVTRCARVA